MKIEQFEIIGKSLFWAEEKTLIMGDLHLGYEESLNEQGVVFPKAQFAETIADLEQIFAKTGRVNRILLLGDVKHHFAGILGSEFEDFYKLVDFFKKNLLKDGKIIITKGNHDSILEPVVRNYEIVKLVNSFRIKNVLFFHGDAKSFLEAKLDLLDNKLEMIILGHFHPAISLKEDMKKEKYKCFLFGVDKKSKKKMIVLPSFFTLIEGTSVNETPVLGNWLDVSSFEVFALDNNSNIYDFGKLKKLLIKSN